MLEDPNRRYYNEGELKEFDGIESEWPLFYVMMIIDGVFRTLPDQVEEYQKLLKARIYMDEYGGNLNFQQLTKYIFTKFVIFIYFIVVCEMLLNSWIFADPVIPWYYYVPREAIENERSEPNSVRRIPASKF